MSEFKKLHEFTDGNRTGQVFFTDIGNHRFMALLYQADLDYNDAHAAHIVSHSNSGKSVPENMKMVRAKYNIEMGQMNLEDYKQLWIEQQRKAS